ncbi:MAG: anhydro-N-acetylmuramic acid kinase [Cyanobacteriota bacterium]|nr:anhydro-N-acetylmuramic acid kinase [Cyanobacteriota bacterium]
MRVLGLMSGTSADGVDAVLVRFRGPPAQPHWEILSSGFHPYPDPLRREVIAVGQGALRSSAALLELGEAVTEAQAAAAVACDPTGSADLVGCHGQTLWHRPASETRRGASWQLLHGPLLARLLARPVVFDFRSADLALGGQGAPLVPPCDEALLGRSDGWRGVLNLGGIANLTLIPPATGDGSTEAVRGWDCGPANSLLDLAVQHFSRGQLSHDVGGLWAREGQVHEAVVQTWLEESYLRQPPPKSTGRELFGATDLQRRLTQLAEHAADALKPADALASLTAFSAAAVAQDLDRGPRPLELLVAGGGARNAALIEQLRQRCSGIPVRQLEELGIADNQREALAFALLAWWHWLNRPGSAPSVTGASGAAVLGVCARP